MSNKSKLIVVVTRRLTNQIQTTRRNYSAENINSCYLKGVFPSLATPFDRLKNEPIAWDKFEFNLRRLTKLPFAGYALHGFYGEYPYLTNEERAKIVRFVRTIIGNDKPIIVGSSSESLKKTIDICQAMKESGANYSLLFTPHYYKKHMTYSALLDYFTKVADKSPIPIILHNVPSTTFIDLPVELCCDLSDHPNIVAIKECSHNIAKIAFICEHVKQTGKDFSVLAGSSSFLLDALRVGALGCVTAIANVLGEDLIKLIDLYNKSLPSSTSDDQHHLKKKQESTNKYLQEAYAIQNRLIGPDLALSEVYGVAGLKACLDAFNFYGGPCRLPLMELNQEEKLDLKTTFEQNGYKWIANGVDAESDRIAQM